MSLHIEFVRRLVFIEKTDIEPLWCRKDNSLRWIRDHEYLDNSSVSDKKRRRAKKEAAQGRDAARASARGRRPRGARGACDSPSRGRDARVCGARAPAARAQTTPFAIRGRHAGTRACAGEREALVSEVAARAAQANKRGVSNVDIATALHAIDDRR